jgi:predicted MPP superfamily phosphohydrolase
MPDNGSTVNVGSGEPGRGRVSRIHQAIVLADLLGSIPPLAIGPALAGMAASAGWPWRQPTLQAVAALVTLALIAIDGASLALLPRRGRSFGPVTPPLLVLALLRSAFTFGLGALWAGWPALVLTLVVQLGLTAAHLYATWVEPLRLDVTRLELLSPKLRGGAPLRVLHLSDVHFERWTARERQLVREAQALAPDLILMTGDYLNLSYVRDPEAHAGVRELLAAVSACAPTYAVTGSPPVDLPDVVPAVFLGLPITWLCDETREIDVAGQRVRLVGVRCSRDREQDGARLRRLLPQGAGDVFTVLLYHSPDLMPYAVECEVDLYLAGHTHGGQLRLPLFGALITSSDFWKRYEAGHYEERGTTLYVSRGLGMEGMGAPRARFLAPPEVILWSLVSAASRASTLGPASPPGVEG